MAIDATAAVAAARERQDAVVAFLRDMIAIPAESGREGERCERVRREYLELGFEDVRFDALGSVVARIGHGPFTILMDGHVDCVGVGDRASWRWDPFVGKLEDGHVYGRGAVDELPAIACMAHGMRILAEHGVPDGVSVFLCSSVLEEDCDGYPLMHLVEKEGIRPDAVILGEPTDLDVYRGHRGRMGVTITTRGVSAHGAHCERGVNAVYALAPIIADVEALNERLPTDPFLGKGTVTVSWVDCTSPSFNAVPDGARIVLDRRLTAGETPERALEELRSLPHIGDAEVELLVWEGRSWRGLAGRQEQVFPTWVLPAEHPLVGATADCAAAALGRRPAISRWTFSTNGVATMGRLGIPTVGFAPGQEALAHTTEERVAVADLDRATAAYALMPAAVAAAMAPARS